MRGRIRSIKPEALSDEELWDAELRSGMHLYRVFTGLWMFADREGRFEWRPRALKAVILPYWDGDFASALAALEGAGFIVRYTVEGREYGHVRTFGEHQTPNHKEPPSKIPPPPPADYTPPREGPGRPGPGPGEPREGPALVPGNPATSGNGIGIGNGNGVGTDSLACVRAREVPPSAAEIQTRFRGLYLERFGSEPYMGGGEAVRSFAERLIGTARARGVDPLALLGEAFTRWQPKPDEEIAQNAPYATFAGRFGSLLESQHGSGLSEREQLQADQAAAIKAKDMDRYRSLAAEERRRFGGGGDADAAR